MSIYTFTHLHMHLCLASFCKVHSLGRCVHTCNCLMNSLFHAKSEEPCSTKSWTRW
ncbi:hypothetical protein BKA80DRAFT_260718 [Phyllosticta citrichinensis]